jgi:hypothetical protein
MMLVLSKLTSSTDTDFNTTTPTLLQVLPVQPINQDFYPPPVIIPVSHLRYNMSLGSRSLINDCGFVSFDAELLLICFDESEMS